MKLCQVLWCTKKLHCKGKCKNHYISQWKRDSRKKYRESHPLPTNEERFFKKVKKTAYCWEWLGCKNGTGYGWFGMNKEIMGAHRASYELFVGKIPKGMTIDHKCRNRSCVNPKHLRVMSFKENNAIGNSPSAINARKTHCKRGHEFTKENTYINQKGERHCRTCFNMLMRNYRKKLKLAQIL